jgi:hypothetical protein
MICFIQNNIIYTFTDIIFYTYKFIIYNIPSNFFFVLEQLKAKIFVTNFVYYYYYYDYFFTLICSSSIKVFPSCVQIKLIGELPVALHSNVNSSPISFATSNGGTQIVGASIIFGSCFCCDAKIKYC